MLTTNLHDSDLLTDLCTAGELTVPAESPLSNKREREDSDNESQQSPSISPPPAQQLQHPMSTASAPYPSVPMASAETPRQHTSTRLGAEFASPPPTAPVSSPMPPAVLTSEVAPDAFSPPVHSVHSNNVTPVLLPRPYSGSYQPLGGSSGLGRATPAIELPPSASAPTIASFGAAAALSDTSAFVTPPTQHGHGNGTLSLTTGPGGAPSLGMGMVLDNGGPYDFTASASTPASVSASSNSSSPHTGFRSSTDFSTGEANEAFDMTGMDMTFGGYGVPSADKEAMLRHFAPLLLQDGQIGVDRDTMTMWSTMPSSYECVFFFLLRIELIEAHGRTQDWETYMSSMMGMANTNAVDLGIGVDVGRL
jgi:hypothetical protein